MSYSYDRRTAVTHLTLDASTRRKANAALIRKGFDGNSRFRSMSQALSEAMGVLSDFGIEADEVLSAWTYKPKTGTNSINLAFSNPEDSFSPVQISNSTLYISWTELETGYEVIAYLS
jgi:hypothetical protein